MPLALLDKRRAVPRWERYDLRRGWRDLVRSRIWQAAKIIKPTAQEAKTPFVKLGGAMTKPPPPRMSMGRSGNGRMRRVSPFQRYAMAK